MAFTTTEDLICRIEAAFPNTKWEGERACPHECIECDDLDMAIRQKAWQHYTPTEARHMSAGTSLFGPEAFNHFLPAYMRASLFDQDEADVVPDSVAHCFLSGGPGGPFRTPGLLEVEQREVLFDWLEWWIDQSSDGSEEPYFADSAVAKALGASSAENQREELAELRLQWL